MFKFFRLLHKIFLIVTILIRPITYFSNKVFCFPCTQKTFTTAKFSIFIRYSTEPRLLVVALKLYSCWIHCHLYYRIIDAWIYHFHYWRKLFFLGVFGKLFLQREIKFSFSGILVIIADLHLLLLGRFRETLALGYGLISSRSSSSFSV